MVRTSNLVPRWEARLPEVEAEVASIEADLTIPHSQYLQRAESLRLLAKRLRNAIRVRRYVDAYPLRGR